ncbi:glycosyltransferase family 2 protein [Rhodopseudomonas palustris]|uniref:Glycosyltransferase family 2 protein n=1 Tax=Rhodopseudomonas palustris (strain ATCC BAA-98 / CGA009) TaxID=258594 RepID=Q6N2J3_RHOPA|nr:glycosyltransferase family 2 protein [Rhodopseudomonas palustris]OPF92535.1 glycosyltransferase [Rhodopseudomonas palustris]PPQ43489.1 glycosyltransferase [Rhodopseudomonas palustris]QQM05619.1 putative glycosyltransferase [Rhodopseudomonas palustris]RJF63850.1 glycosyltransferase [Rhodopseudomonas palustris]WAB76950.1 glycosyltransferase family 2 protein [Rhodopseudomonas palustris]
MSSRTLLSIVTPCYNEEENVEELYRRIKAAIAPITQYDFEILIIDNASEDGTAAKVKRIAAVDPTVKLIINTRNFGHIRSPYYGIIQSTGAATIYLASDLQDPPEIIPEFIREWEKGYKLVMAIKPISKGNALVHSLRKSYYRVLDGISDISLLSDSTGFGLYDRAVLDHIRKINDPYPYLRGLICELGYEIKTIPFEQPRRLRGISKNNLYTLYDIAMLGVVSHSKVPIRIAAFLGFLLGTLSVLAALAYLVLKLMYWDQFPVGVAPIVISVFFLFGVQFMFVGILGEYIGSIHTYVQRRPTVVEKERINF